ncbi:DUF397 domain-containing protein [Streptomyces sp. ET3-23]|uniref:DUF397 domain-containing protein n=1 Tax=Streptomyces sp. ET3-23 TaxID=2885643 RepID=UPI001D0F61B5|nr:DUF397 domain-containing protein [Streptomyces sp. ET3-23]MCC2280285.1 DUF397 domain-containing protein [Streptomyces sp. ET3-23]
MGDQDSRPRWRKSSFSGTGRECVEVAFTGPSVLVRDSNSTAGPVASFPGRAWAEFIAGLRR